MADDNKVFGRELVTEIVDSLNIADLENATIGEILLVASALEERTGIPFIRMDQGSPGLPPNRIGIEAEKAALDSGIVSQYPAAAGVPVLKEQASRFVKAFLDIDISARSCIPTTGGVAASFASFIACTQRLRGKDKVLFVDPGFPIQKSQLRILGIDWVSFDIYGFRGYRLKEKLESMMSSGDIAAIVYSNPNNPAWIVWISERISAGRTVLLIPLRLQGIRTITSSCCPLRRFSAMQAREWHLHASPMRFSTDITRILPHVTGILGFSERRSLRPSSI